MKKKILKQDTKLYNQTVQFFPFLSLSFLRSYKCIKKKKTQKTEKQTYQSVNSDCLWICEIENAFKFSSFNLHFLTFCNMF